MSYHDACTPKGERYPGRVRAIAVSLFAVAFLAGCSMQRPLESAVMRDSAPPWDAPRDAVSYIDAAGLSQLRLDDDSDPWIVRLKVTVSGEQVEVPAFIGIDRVRAVQAPAHTHDPGGEVWLEGEGNREVTLGQFFTLWGVRFDQACLGEACDGVRVSADGSEVGDPQGLVLRGVREVAVEA